MRTVFAVLVLVAGAIGGLVYYTTHVSASSVVAFRTSAIAKGNLLATISATGTVEPEELVDVGAQVAGLIVKFGPDPKSPSKLIDYNSVVEKDQELAYIDQTSYIAAVDQAQATLEKSKADLLQMEAKCQLARQEKDRAESLRKRNAIADTDYDTVAANCKAAEANVAVGKATILANEAALRTAKVNLGYTIIKSPVRGTIIARRVNIGQTVVASLSAPSLFLIAKDLTRMQVWASVNEADIGQIHVGMPARFTVDTYPGKNFRGTVTQIRMDATMTQNVVTYTVVVTTDNTDMKLFPYMTANVKFEVQNRQDIFLVPNAVLRWRPESTQVDPNANKVLLALAAKSVQAPAAASAEESAGQEHRCVWVTTGPGLVKPMEVIVGATDGTKTELSGEGVKDGLRLVSGVEDTGSKAGSDEDGEEKSDSDETSNPFLPKLPKGSRPPPGPM
jgi:HlyD family secretion protein